MLRNVRIELDTGREVSGVFDAMLDTGASRSVVPARGLADLGVAPRGLSGAFGFEDREPPGETSVQVAVFHVLICVPGLAPTFVRAFGMDRTTILLGRDFLNHFWFSMNARCFFCGSGPAAWLASAILRLVGQV